MLTSFTETQTLGLLVAVLSVNGGDDMAQLTLTYDGTTVNNGRIPAFIVETPALAAQYFADPMPIMEGWMHKGFETRLEHFHRLSQVDEAMRAFLPDMAA